MIPKISERSLEEWSDYMDSPAFLRRLADFIDVSKRDGVHTVEQAADKLGLPVELLDDVIARNGWRRTAVH